jgi:raffinose/stachyose/melibiose transport system substrate-binding protein
MKRFFGIVVIIAVFAAMLAGCGNAATTDESTSDTASGTAQTAQSVTTAEAPKDVTLTVMHHMGEDTKRNGLKAWTDEFTKQNANVKFDVTNITDVTQYRNLMKTKLAAGDPADIMFGNASQYKDIIQAGHVADLTNTSFIKNCDENAVKGLTIDGKAYGIPIDIGALVVFYNKDIFADNGLSVPTTYDEYLKLCQTLQSKNIMSEAWGLKDSWIANVETQMDIWPDMSAEPDLFKDTETRAKKFADFTGFKRALERTAQRIAFQSGDVLGTDHNASVQLFATGKAAMLNQGTWDIGAIKAANKDGNFGVFALPADKAEDTLMRISVDDSWMIADKSANKDVAIKFFEYVTSPEGGKAWTDATSTISAVKGADASSLDPMTQDVLNIMNSGKVINSDTLYQLSGQMSTYFDTWCQEYVVDKDRSVDKYIEKLDKQFDTMANTK